MSSASASSPPRTAPSPRTCFCSCRQAPRSGGVQAGGALHFHLNKVVNLYVAAPHRAAPPTRRCERIRADFKGLQVKSPARTYGAVPRFERRRRSPRESSTVKEASCPIPMEHEGDARHRRARAGRIAERRGGRSGSRRLRPRASSDEQPGAQTQREPPPLGVGVRRRRGHARGTSGAAATCALVRRRCLSRRPPRWRRSHRAQVT